MQTDGGAPVVLGWQQIGEHVSEGSLTMTTALAGEERWARPSPATAARPSWHGAFGSPQPDVISENSLRWVMIQRQEPLGREVLRLVDLDDLGAAVRPREDDVESSTFPRGCSGRQVQTS